MLVNFEKQKTSIKHDKIKNVRNNATYMSLSESFVPRLPKSLPQIPLRNVYS